MPSRWTDPDDVRPDAKKSAREVGGWRQYDPLRRMFAMPGTSVTTEHIHAADLLRTCFAEAALGRSTVSALWTGVVVHAGFGPVDGLPAVCARQTAALRQFVRAMRPFCEAQRRMVWFVLLDRNSIRKWAAAEGERLGRLVDTKLETGRLVGVLDTLATHYASEIEAGLKNGTIMQS